ncbi:MAG: hypothetical protein A2W99_13555 [Bacteroidetes bacterium GWF2_33_16]|nr:MAG: hypothetical protein A2X00_08210 [Bacteroidetes bacterium GWE2_32_14]OFY06701.1 MAG: hypothetical protein A2W99_13555 [Bacteroidetes bacterium GWF2_33_16]
MKRLLIKRILIYSILSILFCGSIFTILLLTSDEPPVKEINDARIALFEAKKSGADQFAIIQLKNAEISYDSSIFYLKGENQKIFYKRDYTPCKNNAISSFQTATQAKEDAIIISKNFKKYLEEKIDSIDCFLNHFKDIFITLPLDKDIFADFTKGKILLTESKYAFENQNLTSCNIKLDLAYQYLNRSYEVAKLLLNNYFELYPKWISWADETINYSKRHKTSAIIVDKFSKKIYLYQSGVLKYSTEVELGKNWIGFKLFYGDKATPEGRYSVIKKKKNPHTKYHKALLLNYPNNDDKVRYTKAKSQGQIPGNRSIGNLIEIHGGGGQGANWTDGCVALRNKDMDKLFQLVGEETPVTIVGSLLSLSEIMNDNIL